MASVFVPSRSLFIAGKTEFYNACGLLSMKVDSRGNMRET